ncbi:MAG: hypothetical protein KDB23_09210 [Planctomycetales bacterium]|nr:hypothetical protein [Planctomycetales bacterium]
MVYHGDWSTTTQGRGPDGGPKEFDIRMEFQQPFHYDPSHGNLLYDFRTGTAAPLVLDIVPCANSQLIPHGLIAQ